MARVVPFRALRPRPELAEKVASPPYDVLSSDEAREMAEGNPISFLHVNKPEIDLPVETDLYADEVYATGAANLRRFIAEGVFLREPGPASTSTGSGWATTSRPGWSPAPRSTSTRPI